MKILLSAFIGSHNLGDEAIAEVVIDAFEKASDIQLSVLSVNPSKTRKMSHGTTKVYRAGFGNFAKQLRHCDALVLGGGGIIQDESSIINMTYYYLQTFVAKRLFRKPVFWVCVGVGPIKNRLSHAMLRDMARMTTHTLVRDKESAALLSKHGFSTAQITTAHDCVFNYPIPKSATQAYRPEEYMLFCPRDWFFVTTFIPTRFALKRARRDLTSQLQLYRLHMLQLVEKCLDANPTITIVGVAFFYSQDLDLLQWIHSNLGHEHRARYIVESRELTPHEFITMAMHAKAILGVRLHSLILGAVADCPLVPLVYSEKVSNLVNYLGVGKATTWLQRPDFDVDHTVKRLTDVLHKDSNQSEVLLGDMRRTNLQAFDQLISSMQATAKHSQ